MNNKIKIVRRIGIPETNSSSSHAVSISMSPGNLIKPGDPEWDITIEDGVLKVPGDHDFGWEYFKSNHVLLKLQYLCGIYCSEINTDWGKKRITKLKKILRKIFEVPEVEFLWITEYTERIKEVGPEEAYYSYPEIDHNSHDIFEEITENLGTIRQFLLSRDSWIYGGNDNSDAPLGFYTEPIKDNQVRAIISIDFGGIFGRIDWELAEFPSVNDRKIYHRLSFKDEFDILSGIHYDKDKKEFSMFIQYDDEAIKLETGGSLMSFSSNSSLYNKDGKTYIVFADNTFNRKYSDIRNTYERKELYGLSEKILGETMAEMKEGENYLLKEVKIKLLDYGFAEI